MSAACSSVDSEVPTFFEAVTNPQESSSPDGATFASAAEVAERAALVQANAPKCGRIVAQTDGKTWLCLSCAEPHPVQPYPDRYKYSSWRYFDSEKARREMRIRNGLCAECGKARGPDGTARLCAQHRTKAAERKRRMRARNRAAVLDNLYGHRADVSDLSTGFSDGIATFAHGASR